MSPAPTIDVTAPFFWIATAIGCADDAGYRDTAALARKELDALRAEITQTREADAMRKRFIAEMRSEGKKLAERKALGS